jgi:hypothetical protein
MFSKEPPTSMKLTPWYLVALAPFAALGFSGALTGHIAVLLVVLGIFFGTLSLDKFATAPKATEGDQP